MTPEEKTAQSDFRPLVTRDMVRRSKISRKAREDALEIIKEDHGGQMERVLDKREEKLQGTHTSED